VSVIPEHLETLTDIDRTGTVLSVPDPDLSQTVRGPSVRRNGRAADDMPPVHSAADHACAGSASTPKR
jgi:hypothetical protein